MTCSRILLDHFVKLTDAQIDLLNSVTLFLTCGSDFLNQSGGFANHGNDSFQKLASIYGHLDGPRSQFANLLGG